MIQEFSVTNYRSIKDTATLSFVPNRKIRNDYNSSLIAEASDKVSLLKLGILYGYNASGKSNIIRAVRTMRSIVLIPSSSKNHIDFYDPFLFDKESSSAPTVFSVIFFRDGIKHEYSIEYNGRAILHEILHYYPESSKRRVFERRFDLAGNVSSISFGPDCAFSPDDITLLKANLLASNSVLCTYERTNVSSAVLDRAAAFFRDELSDTVTPATDLAQIGKERICRNRKDLPFYENVMRKADFQISGIEVSYINQIGMNPSYIPQLMTSLNGWNSFLGEKNMRYGEIDPLMGMDFRHRTPGGDFYLPQEEESNGTLRYLGLSSFLHDLITGTHVLFIDELDSSLHPDLVSYFLSMFLSNSGQSQLFASTHNVLLMDMDYMRRDMIWLCSKKEDGSSDYCRVQDFSIHKNNSLMRFYMAGKLGTVPDFPSPVIAGGEHDEEE